jgi:hypothetical protein
MLLRSSHVKNWIFSVVWVDGGSNFFARSLAILPKKLNS